MRTQYFNGDEYNTPDQERKGGICEAIKRSRFIFIISFAIQVFRSRRTAIKKKYDREQWAGSSINIMKLLENSGGRFHISGFDNIRDLNEPLVFISNHMSTLETMVFPGLIAPIMDVTFIVKDNLVNHPIFGPVMRARNPIVVSRENSRSDLMEVINKGSEFLMDNTSVIVFPQSSRRDYFKVSGFNSLGVKLASKNKVRVVPMAIKTDYWQNGKMIKDLGPFDRDQPINIVFGKPIDTARNPREAHKIVVEFIVKWLNKWGVRVEE